MKPVIFLIMRYLTKQQALRVSFALCILCLSSTFLQSQNNGVYKKLYYSIYLSNSNSTDFLKNKNIHKATLKSLHNFYEDKQAVTRSKAYGIARNIYNYSEKSEIKERVIEDHLKACINDRSPSLRFQLSNHLIQFDKKYFNQESLALIQKLIEEDPNQKQYIVIAGYKDLDINLPNISEFTDKQVLESWTIVQAMARIGNDKAIDFCRKIVKEHPLDIKFFDVLLPGLVFTNDREIFDAIIDEIINDDFELIGQRLKDYQRYFMLKSIIPLIYEYPYQFVDESQLTTDEFYQQLHFAVDWVQKNRASYTLIDVESPMKEKSSLYGSKELSAFDF